MANTHFFGSEFFAGEFFFSSTPRVVIDTHDGGDRKRYNEKRREAQARLRQQITDAVDPAAAAERMRAALGSETVSVQTMLTAAPSFDFDADDDEIILLL